jgi:hypothetical protein
MHGDAHELTRARSAPAATSRGTTMDDQSSSRPTYTTSLGRPRRSPGSWPCVIRAAMLSVISVFPSPSRPARSETPLHGMRRSQVHVGRVIGSEAALTSSRLRPFFSTRAGPFGAETLVGGRAGSQTLCRTWSSSTSGSGGLKRAPTMNQSSGMDTPANRRVLEAHRFAHRSIGSESSASPARPASPPGSRSAPPRRFGSTRSRRSARGRRGGSPRHRELTRSRC